MDEIYKNYEKTIKKKHSIKFTPKYKEKFKTDVNNTLFIAIAQIVFEKLGWDLTYKDENTIEAIRKEKKLGMEHLKEVIIASYEYGNVSVTSKSLDNAIWDAGRNSKRVKLFIYAFEETLKTFDRQSLNALEKEVKKKNNWDDYVIPEILPQPTQAKTPNIAIPIVGGFIISLILGFLFAFISAKGVYIIGLFEFLVAMTFAFGLKHLIKRSNYIDLGKLKYVLIAMTILIYLSNQYFQYEIILDERGYERFGFWNF